MSSSQLKQQVSAALERRETMIAPLEALAAELPQAGRNEIDSLVRMLRESHSVEQWLEHPRAAVWLPLIASEESSSDTSRRIARLLQTADTQAQLQSRRWAALLYPLIVFGLAIAVFIGLSVLIVPEFAEMYDGFGLLLPASTELVIWSSRQLTEFLPRTVIVIAVLVGITISGHNLLAGRATLARWPRGRLEGGSRNLRAMAGLTGSIAELLSIGASVPEALKLSARGCNHVFLSRSLDRLAIAACNGNDSVRDSIAARWFPANVVDAISQADQPSAVPTLRSLSLLYHDRADCRIDWIRLLLGPMALVAVGVVVGFVVLSLFMPLIRLVSNLS